VGHGRTCVVESAADAGLVVANKSGRFREHFYFFGEAFRVVYPRRLEGHIDNSSVASVE
jgi:hypothetical protein